MKFRANQPDANRINPQSLATTILCQA